MVIHAKSTASIQIVDDVAISNNSGRLILPIPEKVENSRGVRFLSVVLSMVTGQQS